MQDTDSIDAACSFPEHMWGEIGFYVYRLVDPRTNKTFYVGKGYGDRVFQHARGVGVTEESEFSSSKLKQIQSILSECKSVGYVIHRHGLTEAEAFHVEAALIDAYEDLTNLQAGHATSDKGKMPVGDIVRLYGLPSFPAVTEHDLLLIKIPKLERNATEGDIFQLVRYCWRVNKGRADKADYVVAVHLGRTLGVYKAAEWLPATAENFQDTVIIDGHVNHGLSYADGREAHRFGFHGYPAPQEIKSLYVGDHGKRLGSERFLKAQNPIGYISANSQSVETADVNVD